MHKKVRKVNISVIFHGRPFFYNEELLSTLQRVAYLNLLSILIITCGGIWLAVDLLLQGKVYFLSRIQSDGSRDVLELFSQITSCLFSVKLSILELTDVSLEYFMRSIFDKQSQPPTIISRDHLRICHRICVVCLTSQAALRHPEDSRIVSLEPRAVTNG